MFDWGSESMEEFYFRNALRFFALDHSERNDVRDAITGADSVADIAAVIAGPLAAEVSARSVQPPEQGLSQRRTAQLQL